MLSITRFPIQCMISMVIEMVLPGYQIMKERETETYRDIPEFGVYGRIDRLE